MGSWRHGKQPGLQLLGSDFDLAWNHYVGDSPF